MPIDALSVSCVQLTHDLLAIAKFLFLMLLSSFTTNLFGMMIYWYILPRDSMHNRGLCRLAANML